MAKLWFQNRLGVEKIIADCDTWEDVSKCINLFIDQRNEGRPKDKQFKSYYMRIWEENGRTVIDVGSWSEFFFWDKVINREAELNYDSQSGGND